MNPQLKTSTRTQRLANLLAHPLPLCTSPEFKTEYYKITRQLRNLQSQNPKDVRHIWMINLLSDALNLLLNLNDPTSTPTNSRKEDSRRWTELLVRRTMVERFCDEEAEAEVTFYDCYDALREGRSKAAQVRLYEQVRRCWEGMTGTDLGTGFRIAV